MPFKPCSSFVVSGATKSGKTWWVYRLLSERVGMFVPNPPSSILYCYGVYQPLFDDMKMTFGDDIRFVEGLPSSEDVDNLTLDGRHHIIILDDVMQKVVQSPEMALLFTQLSSQKLVRHLHNSELVYFDAVIPVMSNTLLPLRWMYMQQMDEYTIMHLEKRY